MRKSFWFQLPWQQCWLVSAQGWAHHAFSAEFDANKPLKLRGQRHQDGLDQSSCLAPYRR